MPRGSTLSFWIVLLGAAGAAIGAAAFSPLLAWRDSIYIAAGFAGIVGLALMMIQPLLVAGLAPGIPRNRGRRFHRFIGVTLVVAVFIHVAALWITSPPDVIDVLLFRSPAPFSLWGAIAMWAVFLAGGLALFRHRLRLQLWRWGHTAVVSIAVIATVTHALMIEGTMEPVTRAILCMITVFALAKGVIAMGVWRTKLKRRSQT